MRNQYLFSGDSKSNESTLVKIKSIAFLSLALIITEILIEFLYKFSPNNYPQFLVVCVFSGFLSCWLLVESYSVFKQTKSNGLLLLGLLQLIYGLSRELFLIINYQENVYFQYLNAIQRLDFKAFPFIFVYCIIFALQLAQILKLFVENERAANQEFLRILNSQPISIICFARSGHETIFINTFFKEQFGFNEGDIPSVEDWLNLFKRNAHPCLDYNNGFDDFQTEIHNAKGESRTVRVSREVTDNLIIDVLLDITEEERKNLLIRQNQKELLSRSISDKEYALERVNTMAEEFSTENKILMSSLLKANKTLSSGALAASIAHELTQPLTAMNINLELMLLQMNKKTFNLESGKKIAHKIIHENNRIGNIIHSLRSIFIDQQDQMDLCSLNDAVDSVVSLITPECQKRNISLLIELPKDIKASFRPDEIRQVLLNVLGNAINALENAHERPRVISIAANKMNNHVDLTISDTGPGVPSDLEPNLFELLTTSKKDGMGLGLWLSKYILTKSGGDIKHSRNGEWGAIFQIQLPLTFQPTAIGGGLKPSP